MDGETPEGAPAPEGGTVKKSLAQQYRSMMTRSLTLPSGAEVVIRRGSLMDFVFSGSIPAPLLSVLLRTKGGEDPSQRSQDPGELKQWAEALGMVVAYVCIDPKVVTPGVDGKRPEVHADELGSWEMPDRDKLAIFQTAMADAGLEGPGGDSEERPFPPVPPKHDGDAGSASAGEGVQPEAERHGGPDVGVPAEARH